MSFSPKPLATGIFFSIAVNLELVAKPVILRIMLSASAMLTFKSAFLARSLVSGIFLSASLIFFLSLIYLYHM